MPASPLMLTDGSVAFDAGVDSTKVTTVASAANPNGLPPNGLAWLDNATVRDGGILQRTGWQLIGRIHDGSALYQGGYVYEPDSGYPYLFIAIGGRFYTVNLDTAAVSDISAISGLSFDPTIPRSFFKQGEQFLVIQWGDYVTSHLPFFWDNAHLRQSIGITNPAIATPAPGVNEIPAGGPMEYYMGRLWWAVGRNYFAGDIVGSHNSGTVGAGWRDSILNVTECPLVFGGDGFTVPTNSGSIRAITYNGQLNSALGQGQLLVGTSKAMYALAVPPSRTDWIATDTNNSPQQVVVQIGHGPVNDRSVVRVNGDVFFQTLEPSIASLEASVRYFEQWGNRPISKNEYRVLQYNDRSLLEFSSGIEFNNRLLQTALPRQVDQGVVHDAIVPLDFVPISSFAANTLPNWEGVYEGLAVFQLFSTDYGGRQRAFAITLGQDNGIDLWEITDSLKFDQNSAGQARVTWQVETPAYNFGSPFDLKELASLELSIDKLFGNVHFTVDWRPDFDPCWYKWLEWEQCTQTGADAYPATTYRESYGATITLPQPPEMRQSGMRRMARLGYQFQLRITVKGWCRIRGILLHAQQKGRGLYSDMPDLPDLPS